jgi:large subunit ribosomal protein L29
MKVSEIREMSMDEMRRKVGDLDQELFNLRFQHGTNQLENPRRLGAVRRDIARLKTIIRETELKNEAR